MAQISRISDGRGNNVEASHFGVRQMFTLIGHAVKLRNVSLASAFFVAAVRFLVRRLG